MYLNSVQIIGFVGKDPERRQARSNGAALTVLSVATPRSRENADDEWASKTEWHRVVAWNSLGERVAASPIQFVRARAHVDWNPAHNSTRPLRRHSAEFPRPPYVDPPLAPSIPSRENAVACEKTAALYPRKGGSVTCRGLHGEERASPARRGPQPPIRPA